MASICCASWWLQTALGAMFATYNVKADRLTVLKTSFPEELELTGRSPATAPRVISMVAFRCAAGSLQDAMQLLTTFRAGIVCAGAACSWRQQIKPDSSCTERQQEA